MVIQVKEISNYCATRALGRKFLSYLKEATRDAEDNKLILDFTDVTFVSISFLDESFVLPLVSGELSNFYKIEITGISELFIRKLKRAFELRRYRPKAEEAIGHGLVLSPA